MKSNSKTFLMIAIIIGLLITLFVPYKIVYRLSRPEQSIYALVSALICLPLFYFGKKKNLHEDDRTKKIMSYLPWGIMGEIGMAVFFWTTTNITAKFVVWGVFFNYILSFLCYFSAFLVILVLLFPKESNTSITNPILDPLADFPPTTREVINKGRYWVNAPPGITIFVFFIIAGIGNTINAVKHHDESSNFFFIVSGVGFLLSFTFGIIATFKWQKWARRSGIPEEELKAAAKEVNLWWPNTKVE